MCKYVQIVCNRNENRTILPKEKEKRKKNKQLSNARRLDESFFRLAQIEKWNKTIMFFAKYIENIQMCLISRFQRADVWFPLKIA